MGFDVVVDTNFSADLTIMEEGSELVERVTKGGVLPQMTSCCPGWVKFVEYYYPELIPNLSSARSPMMMHGSTPVSYTHLYDAAFIIDAVRGQANALRKEKEEVPER